MSKSQSRFASMFGRYVCHFNIGVRNPPCLAWHMCVKPGGIQDETINISTAHPKMNWMATTVTDSDICLPTMDRFQANANTEVVNLSKTFDYKMRAGNLQADTIVSTN